MVRTWLVVILLSACTAACLDRTRVNEVCEWRSDGAGALDLKDWANERHLYEDVELAEELAIRYADRMHHERFGSYGHGGLIENGRVRDRCMASLISAIAIAHDLTSDQVEQARARGYRDWRWDSGVLVSFACCFCFIAWKLVRAMSRRFPADEGWPALVAPLVSSIPVGLAALQLFVLWGAALEAFRLGNGHVSSYRSAKVPWSRHRPALWITSVLAFLLIAAVHAWIQTDDTHDLPASDQAV